MKKEKELLRNHIIKTNLKWTKQRDVILETFLNREEHITAEELHRDILKKDTTIGIATVYRALNLFRECGLAQSREFGDGQTRFEHKYNHSHHDHLVCTKCGSIVEFENSDIEKIQESIAHKNQFTVFSHRLELYGLCSKCKP